MYKDSPWISIQTAASLYKRPVKKRTSDSSRWIVCWKTFYYSTLELIGQRDYRLCYNSLKTSIDNYRLVGYYAIAWKPKIQFDISYFTTNYFLPNPCLFHTNIHSIYSLQFTISILYQQVVVKMNSKNLVKKRLVNILLYKNWRE